MIVEDKKEYVLINPDENSFSSFFSNFEKEHSSYGEKHLIIQILEKFPVSKENIFLFLSYAVGHQENGTSFVIIVNDVDIDDFPETLNIVPTLVEAQDIIEMENIQRELGF